MGFDKGKIYSIRSNQTGKVYIGSTYNELPKRLHQHRKEYKCYLRGKKSYITSYEIIKYDDHYIELVENYSCKDRNELMRREGEIMRSMDCVNKCAPVLRSEADAKEHKKIYDKERVRNTKPNLCFCKKEYKNIRRKDLISHLQSRRHKEHIEEFTEELKKVKE